VGSAKWKCFRWSSETPAVPAGTWPTTAGMRPVGRRGTGSTEIRSGESGRSLWATRGGRNAAGIPFPKASSSAVCPRGHSLSTGRSRVRRQTSGADGWKWQPDGCIGPGNAAPAWGRQRRVWHKPPSLADAIFVGVGEIASDQPRWMPARRSGVSCVDRGASSRRRTCRERPGWTVCQIRASSTASYSCR